MIFKKEWEKTADHVQFSAKTIAAMVKRAFPVEKLLFFEPIIGGCANLNIRLHLKSRPFYILRIYLRDKDAAYREQKLSTMLKSTLPIPQIYFIDDYEGYRFAIAEYLSGITLRDLLLSQEQHDLEALMFDTGVILTKIQSHRFPAAGFFDTALEPAQAISSNYLEYAQNCLQQAVTIETLDAKIIARINHYLGKFADFLPSSDEKQLVHADYDPANILVDKQNKQWQITGILDWEFSFSGSPLFDVANMLRYAHKMPNQFEESFLQGLKTSYDLPTNWRTTIHLLNLLSLLDCLVRSTAAHQNQRKDIRALVNYIIMQLHNS